MARKSRKTQSSQPMSPTVQAITYNTALYVRLSVLDGGKQDGDTIHNQQELLENYLFAHPELSLKRIFVDNGESGVDFIRPAWSELMSQCRSGKINCIVVKDLSRLGRNYIETGEYIEKTLPSLGVRLIAINDNYDSLNLNNSQWLMANLKNLVNDLYAKDISRKVSTALRTKKKNGDYIGSWANYGYLKDPDNKNKIVVDPKTAPIVRQIFQWKSDGIGHGQICRRLTEAGILSPSQYRFEKGIVKNERFAKVEWSVAAIKLILTNEAYLGHMVQSHSSKTLCDGGIKRTIPKEERVVARNTHEPIISQELFDKANAVINARKVEYEARQGKYDNFKKPELILKGLLFCANCGKPLYRYKKANKKNTYATWSYQCPTHDTLMTCPYKYINEGDLYSVVYEAIRIELQKCAEVGQIIEKLTRESGYRARLSRFDAEIDAASKELRRITSLRQAIYDDYAAKLITVSEYQFAIEKYNSDLEKWQKRLEQAELEKEDYTRSSTAVNKWLIVFNKFMDEKELTAEMAKALIERVEVSQRNRVSIKFKFRDELEAFCQSIEMRVS